MSFGFSVGDFVAVLQLANRVRQRFVGAPEQFKAISDEQVHHVTTYPMLIACPIESGASRLFSTMSTSPYRSAISLNSRKRIYVSL
jgi:hypothetical protein